MFLEVQEAEEKQGKKAKKHTVLLDGEIYCRCYRKDLKDAGIKTDDEVTAEALRRLETEVFLPRAKRRSLFLLNKKRYTRKEMVRKLNMDGYPVAVTEQTLAYLESLHYVEDHSYAEGYAFSLLTRCSERELVQKMLQKGFEKELIPEAIQRAKDTYREENDTDTNDDSPEVAAIRLYLRKKGISSGVLLEEDKKRRLIQSLYRKGFHFSDIRKVLGEVEGMEEF